MVSKQPEPPREPDVFLAFEAQLGLGAPLGFAGIALDLTLYRFLSLSGGVGLGGSGLQTAAMSRIRIFDFGSELGSILAGVGYSTGPYTWNPICIDQCDQRTWTRADWLNLELAAEPRPSAFTRLRVSLGVAVLTNPSDGMPTSDTNGPGFLLYLGCAVGLGVPLIRGAD
jgi:hypothetical protein